MDTELTPLERDVLAMIVGGNDADFKILQEQVAATHVRARDFTGAGFYTRFEVPVGVRRIDGNKTLRLGQHVRAELEGLDFGAGFVLFVNDGAIEVLEGFTYGEAWPSVVGRYALSYT